MSSFILESSLPETQKVAQQKFSKLRNQTSFCLMAPWKIPSHNLLNPKQSPVIVETWA